MESVRGDARVGEAVARLGGQAAKRGASCAECLEVLVGDDAAEGEVDGVEVGEALDAGEGRRRRKEEEGGRRKKEEEGGRGKKKGTGVLVHAERRSCRRPQDYHTHRTHIARYTPPITAHHTTAHSTARLDSPDRREVGGPCEVEHL